LAFQDEFFVKNLLDVKEKWWVCSWLWSSPVSPFSISATLDLPYTVHTFFPERLSNDCQGLRRTFSEICLKFDPVFLSNRSWNRIKPDKRLQIKGRKNSSRPPNCVKFCTLTPKIC
jgi:hypothetical protein